MNNPSSNAMSCKVVVLGESGVGKTSIISRYINNTFSNNNMSTTGASFAAKTMYFENHDRNLKFEIWDTAGQEKYRSLTKIFYKDASVAVLVYDITRKASFDEVKDYWYNQLKEHAPKKISNVLLKVAIAVAANKADLYEHEEAVPEAKGRDFAKEIGAVFKYTSAKNATGIDDLFKAIGNKYLNPNYEENAEETEDDKEMERIRKQTIKIKQEDQTSKNSAGKKGCC